MHPAGKHDIAEWLIGGRIKLCLDIIEVCAAAQGEFGRNAAGQPEPARRIEQIVGLIPGDVAGEGQNEIGVVRIVRRGTVALAGHQRFGTDRIGPGFLPDDVGFACQRGAKAQRGRIKGILLFGGNTDAGRQQLIAFFEIAAQQFGDQHLFALGGDPAHGKAAFGFEQVAVGPACFGAQALAGRIAALGRNGAHRRGFGGNQQVDALRAIGIGSAGRNRLDGHAAEQPGLDQRAAQIVAPGFGIAIAGLEPRQSRDMLVRQALGFASDMDGAEKAARAKIDALQQGCRAGCMIDDNFGFAHGGEGIAGVGKTGQQGILRRVDPFGIDGIAGPDLQQRQHDRRGIGDRCALRGDNADRIEMIKRARIDHQADPHGRCGAVRRCHRHLGRTAVIADRAQQLVDKIAVFGGAAVDLGKIGNIAAFGPQR